eukprot:gene24548-29861_t
MSKRKDTPADSIKRSISGSIFVGCNILAPQAPLGAALLKKVVEDRGGSFHISQKKQSVDVAPTHVLVSESRDAAREIQAQWPKSTLVTREWINKCARAKQRVDEADFSPFCTAAKSTKVSRLLRDMFDTVSDWGSRLLRNMFDTMITQDLERAWGPGWVVENDVDTGVLRTLVERWVIEQKVVPKALVLARAAAVIRACPFNLHDLPAGTARHLLFIGEDTCRYIDEFVETGRCQAYKDLMANGDLKDSKGVLRGVQGAATKREFQKVPFVGHKTACRLTEAALHVSVRWYDELGLRSLEEDMGFHQLHTDHMGHHLQVMVKRVTSGAARGYEGRDSFDHFFGIFHTSEGGKSGMCRADVVMVPPDEWAFALVGWTGSRTYNRTPSRESHYSDDEEEEEITQKLRLLFQADEENLNWAVVGKEGRPLNPGWFSGMNSYERMLQCRFRVDAENPGNEELVSLLTEMEKLERRLSGDDSTSYAAGGEHEAKVINHKASPWRKYSIQRRTSLHAGTRELRRTSSTLAHESRGAHPSTLADEG